MNSDDAVYIPNEDDRQEYVMLDYGNMYHSGAGETKVTIPWKFGQYERDVLDSVLYALIDVARIPLESRNDPIAISRYLTSAVSSS